MPRLVAVLSLTLLVLAPNVIAEDGPADQVPAVESVASDGEPRFHLPFVFILIPLSL